MFAIVMCLVLLMCTLTIWCSVLCVFVVECICCGECNVVSRVMSPPLPCSTYRCERWRSYVL